MGQHAVVVPQGVQSGSVSRKAEILAEMRRPMEATRGPELRRRPTAALLTCVDERVVPEHVFGCGPGKLYCVRVAGHVVTPEIVCSLEIGIALGCRLVFVLGHSDCGAVRIARAQTGDHFAVVQHIRWATRALPWGADVDQATEANVRHAVLELRSRLRARVEGGILRLATGEWDVLG